MTDACLSEGEKLFIIHSVEDDCRTDGRKCLEYRKIQLETDVISACHGSCHVRIGNTDLLIGAKLQITEPSDDAPDEGCIEFAADSSANASPAFEGRGGEEIANDVVSILTHSFAPAIDLKSLCLIPGKSVWLINVDILILEFSSKANLIDASGIGVKAALMSTRIPKVLFDDELDELEVPEDPSDLISLDTSRIPVLVTLTKIGANYVVDATEKEEAASVSSYVLAIDPEDEIIHSRKMGAGTLFMQPLKSNWEFAKKLAATLHKDLLIRMTGKDGQVSGEQEP